MESNILKALLYIRDAQGEKTFTDFCQDFAAEGGREFWLELAGRDNQFVTADSKQYVSLLPNGWQEISRLSARPAELSALDLFNASGRAPIPGDADYTGP